jgi:hypothetical protein
MEKARRVVVFQFVLKQINQRTMMVIVLQITMKMERLVAIHVWIRRVLKL